MKKILICLFVIASVTVQAQEFIELNRGAWPYVRFTENNSVVARIQGTAGKFTVTNAGGDVQHFVVNTATGKVGIGITNPAYNLDVSGGIRSTGVITNGGGDFLLGKDDGRNQGSILFNRALTHSDWGIGTDNLVINYGGDFEGGVNIQGPKVILDGNVGIGTHLPDTKLTVKGVIHTNEVRVDLSGAVAPDYVFEGGYDLLPLPQVEAYIIQNKHLPEVPSGKEMEENGLNLKEMNLLLLKKVEELTLHLIEQNKAAEEQRRKIESLEREMKLIREKQR